MAAKGHRVELGRPHAGAAPAYFTRTCPEVGTGAAWTTGRMLISQQAALSLSLSQKKGVKVIKNTVNLCVCGRREGGCQCEGV